jgi:glycosyltransferase involved in cell wall biosynthesis
MPHHSDFDLVCVSLTPWESGGYTKSTVQLMTELARRHRVLFVSYAPTLRDAFRHLTGRRRRPTGAGWTARLQKTALPHGGHLYVLTPPWVLPINPLPPGRLYDALLRFNTARIRRSIRRAMRRLDFSSPVVINALHPTLGLGLLGTLGERATVYYCFDEIRAETWSRTHGEPAEQALLRRADAVVVSSAGLLDRKRTWNPRCFLVENGVDFALFHRAWPREAGLAPKTVGYVGAIDNRLDEALLADCFTAFPNVRFRFIGRVPDPAVAERLRRFANVEFVGAVPPAELPDYLRRLAVGLIPFVKNEQTRAIYPLKINEYLAAGMPVVTTDFADLSGFAGVVRVAANAAEFVAALRESLEETDPEAEQRRIAVARENGWERRGAAFGRVLEELNPADDTNHPPAAQHPPPSSTAAPPLI